MLTALSVKMAERPAGIKGIVNKLKRDKIQINVLESRGVALKHVTYISYSGQVKLDKTDKIIGSQRSRLLCSDKLIFPHHSGYKRFSSPSFSARLCTNTALSILQGLENREALRLGIADRRGRHTDFMLSVLKLCADVTVLTSNLGAYRDALDTALTEMGATAALTQNQSDLSDCDFIIIPEKIYEPMTFNGEPLVLGVEKEGVNSPNYFYSYKIKVPNGFAELKPEELDGEYFCSALYTLAAQYELGGIVPVRIEGEGKTRTVETLRAYLAKLLDNHSQK